MITIAIRRPLVGFIIGAALGDPTGWAKDRGLVRMTRSSPPCSPCPTSPGSSSSCRSSSPARSSWLGVAKVALGWPLLIAALFVIGLCCPRAVRRWRTQSSSTAPEQMAMLGVGRNKT